MIEVMERTRNVSAMHHAIGDGAQRGYVRPLRECGRTACFARGGHTPGDAVGPLLARLYSAAIRGVAGSS